jgi:hypothetical protein
VVHNWSHVQPAWISVGSSMVSNISNPKCEVQASTMLRLPQPTTRHILLIFHILAVSGHLASGPFLITYRTVPRTPGPGKSDRRSFDLAHPHILTVRSVSNQRHSAASQSPGQYVFDRATQHTSARCQVPLPRPEGAHGAGKVASQWGTCL